ncbi:MAG: UvrD-helicase domain-containing protein [Acidobacteriota bacterium]|nr:MAG: UvrD-helicase domain-containing protein [Acidobacteriota bacterium]
MERVSLNPDQQRAATAATSVAVTAGAGTGKTAMLSHRYLHHVSVDGLSPLSIVAVTFTEKAAAELRSRIRKVLIEEGASEETIAELEAAQISTIHSLSARICRDHYDIAGLPPDFEIMDDVTSKLWELEKFDEAIAQIPPETVKLVGFSFINEAVAELLKDPFRSDAALGQGTDHWAAKFDEMRRQEALELINSDFWRLTEGNLKSIQGPAGDKLEAARADAVNAMSDASRTVSLKPILDVFNIHRPGNVGAKANWNEGQLEIVRELLKNLRDQTREHAGLAVVDFGPADEAVAEMIDALADAYRLVRQFLREEKLKNKLVDFNDLELNAHEILKNKEAVAHYAERWKAILVDEFQDTNPIQAAIIESLCAGTQLTIVGDEKQSIYGFRGADVDVFARFRGRIVSELGGQQVELSLSYRSHSALVENTNAVFRTVLGTIHQDLNAFTEDTAHPPPFISLHVTEGEGIGKHMLQRIEADFIAEKIASLHAENNVAYKDIAILARVWQPLDIYLDALLARGIPAVHFGGGSLLETREATDIYSLLQFLARPEDNLPLVALLRSPFFAVSDTKLLAAALAEGRDIVWWDAIRRRSEFEKEAAMLTELLEQSRTLTADAVIALADRITGYSAIVANLPQSNRRSADLRGIREFIRDLGSEGRSDVFGVVRSIRELLRAEAEVPRPQIQAGDAVSLMTIHKAKGLEWDVVFVPDLARMPKSDSSKLLIDEEIGVTFSVEGEDAEREQGAIFKLIRARKKRREEAELRRLLYVAITRAKQCVVLSATEHDKYALKILNEGLANAGIEPQFIPFDEQKAKPPTPRATAAAAADIEEMLDTIPAVPASVTATGLSVYAKCPKQFRYQFIEGHPGIAGEGGSNAAKIGSLTHQALEMEVYSVDELRDFTVDATDEDLSEALRLANVFRGSPQFDGVRSDLARYEVPFKTSAGGLNIHGNADYVTDDVVLDFKTDSEMHPDEHQFQLWAYAKAFDRQRAVIAYLRHDTLHEWSGDAFAALDAEAHALAARILAGDHTATPSVANCTYCPFKTICPESAEARA